MASTGEERLACRALVGKLGEKSLLEKESDSEREIQVFCFCQLLGLYSVRCQMNKISV